MKVFCYFPTNNTTNKHITMEQKKFTFFPCTKKTGNACLLGCDKPMAYADGSTPKGCDDCLFWFLPITAVFDLVIMPFRGVWHLGRKCVK